MIDKRPETTDGWVPLTCSYCQARFRVREEYAHLRGRCPSCSFRIAAPFPKPYEPPSAASDSDEPLGLVPVEDEWPEPARLEEREVGPVYGLDAPHVIPAPSQIEDEPDPEGMVYKLADDRPAVAPVAKRDEGPAVTPYKFTDQIGETPPAIPPESLSTPTRATSESGQLPLVELAPPPEPAKEPGTPPKSETAQPPTPIPLQPTTPQPANMIDALFQDTPSAPAPKPADPVPTAAGIPVATYAESIPMADFASPEDSGQPPRAKPFPAKEPRRDKSGSSATLRKLETDTADEKPAAGERKRKKDRSEPADSSPTEKEPVSSAGSPPSDASYTYRLNPAEEAPIRADAPRRPFAEGVFNFPFRPTSIGPLLWIAAGFMVLAIQGRLIMACLDAGLVGKLGLAFVALSMLWVVIWTCSYASACFLAIVQDTANGGDEVGWPEGSWRDWFFPFLRLAWIGLWCGLLCALLTLITCGISPTGVALVVMPPAFLVMLLSSMAGDSWFTLVSGKVLDQLGRRIVETIGVIVGSIILLAITTGAAIGAVVYLVLLAPIAGLVASACWLLYGRLVGRLGWVITHSERKKRRKKKKKRQALGALADDKDGDAQETPKEARPVAESDWG